MSGDLVPDDYGRHVIVGTLFIGHAVAAAEEDAKRKAKMLKVLGDRVEYARGQGVPLPEGQIHAKELIGMLPSDLSPARKTLFMIDLLFSDPFAPNKLKVDVDARQGALQDLAGQVGPTPGGVERLVDTQRSAVRAHQEINFGRIALFGGGALVLLALTAGMAAPFIGGAVGSAAGLSGAAALLHGLAVIGGGSLATGGLGMAGGFWIVTGAGAVVGALGGSTAGLLIELGSEGAKAEIVKLQVSFACVTLAFEPKSAAARMVGELAEQRDDVRTRLAEARSRNDDDAPAVEELEAIVEALSDAMRWMNERLEEA